MIGRVILAVLLAGIAAGLVMGVIQHVRLTPLILEAEAFERAGNAAGHSHDTAATGAAQPEADGHDHDHGEGWAPEDGWQRTLATTVTAAMAGAGFGAMLAGLSLLTGLQITRRNGIIWGLCGFLAVTLAPSVGLPPELPGMAAADLLPRQLWWVCTIAATAGGIYLISTQTGAWALLLAAVLILAPHVIGAPVAPHGESIVPAELVARFVANSIAANAVFWCFIGLFMGLVLDRTAKDIYYMSTEKIPATVITGFLGAGKTTLIRNLLENAKGRRIALIINEFGDVGVDGEILRGCGVESCRDEDVIELANGCICCTVADDFVPTMRKLLDRKDPPQHIVIETSGLALPQPLVRAFNWPEIKSRVTVDGVVTVVDAKALAEGRFADDEEAVQAQRDADPNLDHENPIEELFEDQLNCADMVILNKTDLLLDGEHEAVTGALKQKVRAGTRLVPTRHGQIDVAALLGVGASAEDDLHNRLSHHEMEGEEQHDHDDFVTFIVPLGETADKAALLKRIEQTIVTHDVLRLKGFIDVKGSPARLLVQAVGPRLNSYFDRPWKPDETRGTQLVVIGEKHMDREAITAMLRG